MTTIERQLATVRKISDIIEIKNADTLCVYVVDGWRIVDKIDKFKKDELIIMIEVDSWVPHELAPFLSKGKEPKEFEGIKGERLKTIKLRGELSQGLILPTSIVPDANLGDNVTVLLGIKKYEKPLPACLRGRVKGNFPTEIPKTDQERIQNLSKYFDRIKEQEWEVTEKLHGSSCTFYLDKDNNFHVCSRNLDLDYEENNAYWKAAILYNVESMMKSNNMQGYAVQGELIGEGINGNQYGIKGIDFFVFDVYNANEKRYLNPHERYIIVRNLKLKHVPVINVNAVINCDTVQELLILVEGRKSYLNDSNMEGYVFKTKSEVSDNRDVSSFKVISNSWLLKNE